MNNFTITRHECGKNSYWRAKRGMIVYTRKDLNLLIRFIQTK